MLLGEIYRRLSLGLLSNLAVAETPGVLTELGRKQARLHANDAIRNLSGRFVLKTGSVLVSMQEGRSEYQMIQSNALSGQQVIDPEDRTYFIEDTTTTPFTGRVVKILNVYRSGGVELALNELDNRQSVHSVGDKLTVPFNWPGWVLAVGYQQYLDEIADDADENTEVPIPVVLETAMLFFIASRFFQNMGTQEQLVRGTQLAGQYESECALVENEDLLGQSEIASLPKFYSRGFV